MKKFRKKPVVIEAVQWTEDNWEEVTLFAKGSSRNINTIKGYLEIITLEGTMKANKNDWIIKGIQGEFYPCKPDIFKKTYEEVNDQKDTTTNIY